MQTKEQMVSRLHRAIDQLQQQVKEKDDTIIKLRDELSIAQQNKANKEWVELDD